MHTWYALGIAFVSFTNWPDGISQLIYHNAYRDVGLVREWSLSEQRFKSVVESTRVLYGICSPAYAFNARALAGDETLLKSEPCESLQVYLDSDSSSCTIETSSYFMFPTPSVS